MTSTARMMELTSAATTAKTATGRRLAVRAALFAAGALLAGTAGTAGTAGATPLPNPPFTEGGFVPPDSAVLKAEAAVSKVIAKAVGNGAKCYTKGVANIFAGKGGIDGDGGANACVNDSVKGVAAKAQAAILGKILTYPAPVQACLAANAGTLLGLGSQTQGLLPQALCSGTNDLPAIYGAGAKLPDDKATLKTVLSSIGIFSKAGAGVQKCIDKGIKALAGGADGDGGVAACADGQIAKGEAAFAKLAEKAGGQPACIFDPALKGQAIDSFRQLMLLVTAAIYCAE